MYLTLLTLPFLGSIIASLRGRALGSTGAQLVSTLCLITSAILTLFAFYEVAICRSPVTINLGQWMVLGTMNIQWSFLFDDLTVAMLLPVFCVSSAVHVYSMSYMSEDPHTPRFFSYLSFFTGSMGILVSADSYPLMFVGWELIGVASYLLIGFWLTRAQAQKAAIKAMCVNRVGDTLLSIGFFACLWAFGSLDYATVLNVSPLLNETVLTLTCLLFLGGAMSKSAQIPLHTWLADNGTVFAIGMGGPGTNPNSHGNKGAQKKSNIPQTLTPYQFYSLVGLLVCGPIQILSRFKTSGFITARISLKLDVESCSNEKIDWLISILGCFMIKKGPVVSNDADSRRPHLDKSSFYLFITSTLSVFWPLYTLFYYTIVGPGVRSLSFAQSGCYNIISLAAHITLTGYHTRWGYEYQNVPHGLVIPLWSKATVADHYLFLDRLKSLGIPAVFTWHREKHGGRWNHFFIYVPTTHLGELQKLMGPYIPFFAQHLLKPHY